MRISIEIDLPETHGENITMTAGSGLATGSVSGNEPELAASDGGGAPSVDLPSGIDAAADVTGFIDAGPAPDISASADSGDDGLNGFNDAEDVGGPPQLETEPQPE